ncbi:tRNA1(Val) (adenine(37)-N6)-methyltransferase [Helicobacter canis]|uniref:tRNA1(Val) (adenine(37)-N6)-methyltransferase n=1 Tax=Helicobacter canis TaxID=29419 RepID=UPI0026EAC04C|nr:hypothetical protein [Helicobacter canis]
MAKALRFYQLADGYAYNSDSLLLLDFAAQFCKNTPKNILDMGAGCGILGIMCAHYFHAKVVAIECQPKVALLAAINAKTAPFNTQFNPHANSEPSKPKGSCQVLCADFLDKATPQHALNLLASMPSQENLAQSPRIHPHTPQPKSSPKFDLLLSNPPFYHDGTLKSTNEFLRQARYESQLPLQAWIHQSKKLLTPRGALVFCFQASEIARVLEALKQESFTCETLRLVYPLQSKRAKLVLIYARLDSKAKLCIEPPLFTHNSPEQSDFTQEVAQIYATYRTHSIKVYAQDIVDSSLIDKCGEILTFAT